MSSSIEATLALAIKNYRVIVDSRRFIPLTGQEEFKRVFDLVFGGLLEGFSEVFVFETDQAYDHTAVLSTDSGQASKNATRPERLKVNCKLISLGTDILKLLITLKHFINEPVYADEVLHDVFERAAHLKDFKIVSETSDFDDHKAKKRFETFLVNLYVLLYEDSSLNSNVNLFFCNLSSSRLQTVLFEAAPRASQEEIYRKSYRHLLLNISSINETFPQIIKRLDSYFPEPEMIEGLSRKNFLLDRLGWRNLTVYQCAEKLNQNIIKNCKAGVIKEATRNFEYFWILMAECKFVAVDECCATLFIFPSECESFLKLCLTLSNSFTEITKQNNLTEEEAKIFNEINKEISVWIKKLVKAVSSNYIHFERDINNRSYQKTNKQLYKIIAVLTNFSKGIFDHLQHEFKDLPLHKPAGDIKIVADFVFVESTEKFAVSTENDAVEMTGEGVSEPGTEATEDLKATETSTYAEPYTAINITKPTDTDSIVTNADKEQVPIWAIAVAIVSTLIAAFCIKTIFFNSHKN